MGTDSRTKAVRLHEIGIDTDCKGKLEMLRDFTMTEERLESLALGMCSDRGM